MLVACSGRLANACISDAGGGVCGEVSPGTDGGGPAGVVGPVIMPGICGNAAIYRLRLRGVPRYLDLPLTVMPRGYSRPMMESI